MSPQQKENVVLTWRVLALALLAGGQTLIFTEVREVKQEMKSSHEFRIEQRAVNREYEKMLIELKNNHRETNTEIKELKTYYWESVGRDRNN